MTARRQPIIRYRLPLVDGTPEIGAILMGDGPRVRRAYRILSATRTKSALVGLGVVTWKLIVEPMSAVAGREEIDSGVPGWSLQWDKRSRRKP